MLGLSAVMTQKQLPVGVMSDTQQFSAVSALLLCGHPCANALAHASRVVNISGMIPSAHGTPSSLTFQISITKNARAGPMRIGGFTAWMSHQSEGTELYMLCVEKAHKIMKSKSHLRMARRIFEIYFENIIASSQSLVRTDPSEWCGAFPENM